MGSILVKHFSKDNEIFAITLVKYVTKQELSVIITNEFGPALHTFPISSIGMPGLGFR